MKSNKDFIAMMILVLTGLSVTMLNQSIMNVALPMIMQDFQVEAATAQWLSTGYMLVNGILVPVSAYLVNKFSYKQLFIAAILFFTLGSVVCAMSNIFVILLVGRLIQAVGGGILMPLSMNIFMNAFPSEKRGSAMGILGIGVVLAPAIGPTVSGYVLQSYHWNVLFAVMALLGFLVLLSGLFFFQIDNRREAVKLDVLGVVLSSAGFGLLLYGISEGTVKGWNDIGILSVLAASLISLLVYVITSLHKENPLLDLSVFKDKTFTMTLIINSILSIVLYSGMILLPIYLQSVRGFSTKESGLLMLPGSIVMGLMGVITGKLYDRFGIKPLAIIGVVIMAAVTFLMSFFDLNTTYFMVLTLYTLRSVGMAFVVMPISPAGLINLPPDKITHGTAVQNTLKQVAGSAGTAMIVATMTTAKNGYLDTAASYGKDIQLMASIHGIQRSFMVATVITLVSLILTMFLKNKQRR
jgi:EmrB/QacA subfamily drug resistance transporter